MIEVIEYKEGMDIKPPMFIANMPDDVYHNWPDSISKSGLDLVHRSPAHYKFSKGKQETRQMVVGRAVHCAVFEPKKFLSNYLLLKHIKDRTKSEYKQAIKAKDESLVLVSTEADMVSCIYETMNSSPAIQYYISNPAWHELSLFVTNPETDVLVRCRFDMLTHDGIAIDLKTTQDVRPEAFAKSIANYRYHVQQAFYSDAFFWATGEQLQEFVFIALEKEQPNAHRIYVLDDESVDIGRIAYMKDLKAYAHSVETNHWSGADCFGPESISLPSWAIARAEESIVEEIF